MGSTRQGGTRGVIRNSKGDWVVGYMGNLYMTNNMKAELIALLQGLQIALERGLVPLEVNVDCKEIKTLIQGEHPTYENILSDCRDLLHRLGNPLIHHTFRETNQVADALAKEGAKMDQINSLLCMEVPPVFVSSKLEADKEGTPFVRLSKKSFASNSCDSTSNSMPSVINSCNSTSNSMPLPQNTNSRCPVLPLAGSNVTMHIT
ncbi:hypothetical protein KY290_010065 [Solanum tuberosum]|uniref:RNase H type-1 domain-containing protein n=1 Tax=Solanum tuberosum TaxID=4113 RepID=A0ABQ7VWT1_SOLTU|nr:hypothetical protein KY289_010447 [Solanum tuberosum]KAH0708591.1 hypothetical protein KY284_010018 [Solanum tuberosum]KAH0772928.1 hypothetical protein KY290_010065 [Solanum tuberosum]